MKMEKRKRLKKTAARVCALTLALAVMLSMSGCRESKVIQEILYSQRSEDIDYNNKTKVANNDENNKEKDPNLSKKKIDKSQKKKDDKKVAAKKGTGKNEGKAAKEVGDSNAKSGKANKKQKTDGKDKGKGEASEGQAGGGASEDPNSRQITDSQGNTIDLPEDVSSVVVASSGAGIVQMLGGKDILAGTSESFANNSLAKKVFGSEGISKAKSYWTGDGTTPMNESSFNELLKKKPDVCVGIGGETNFSDSQIARLKKNKIAYVTIPGLNTAYNIENAVQIIGKMIGNRSKVSGGVNAKQLASDYVDYCHNLVDEVTSKTGLFTWEGIDFNNDVSVNGVKHVSGASSDGDYTLYVSDWDSGAKFKASESGTVIFEETGIAAAPQGYSNSPLSYYLSVAGVCNNGARFTNSGEEEYAAIPLAINTYTNKMTGSSLSIYPNKAESFLRVWSGGEDETYLGDSNFPAVIVENEEIKDKIRSSEMWIGRERITVNGESGYGFKASNGRFVKSYAKKGYDIYVNPEGVSSWTKGSVESVLESIWAAWKFSGSYSKNDVKDEIREFYSTFYRYDLSSSELNDILNE